MKRALIAAAITIATALGCTDASRADEPAAREAQPTIYPLHVSLHDQDGAPIGLDAFRGHPVVVSMFYASCPTACPLIVMHVKQIESKLTPEARADVRVLLVSFDPEHDTPAALRDAAEGHHVDLARWKLATGPDDDVRQIAAALGVSYRRTPGGGFAHDSVISVLDREGRVVARTDDPRADLEPLVAAASRASTTR
jgi:protein SCO1/2